MSDAKGQDRNARIGLSSRPSAPRIELKKTVESGVVRQSFSHGRSKAVAVEVKRSRAAPSAPAPVAAKPAPATPVARQPQVAPATPVRTDAPVAESFAARQAALETAPPAAPVIEPEPVEAKAVEPVVAPAPAPVPESVEPLAPAVAEVPAAPASKESSLSEAPTAPAARPVTAAAAPIANAPRPSVAPGSSGPRQTAPPPSRPAGAAPTRPGARPAGNQQRRPMVLKALTDDEKAGRLRALTEARRSEDDARRRSEENSRRVAEESARRRAEEEAALKRKQDEEARRRAEEEVRRRAEEQARKLLEEGERRTQRAGAAAPSVRADAEPGVPVAPRNEEKIAADLARRVGKQPRVLETDEEADGRRGKVGAKASPSKRPALARTDRDTKRPLRPALIDGDEPEERQRSLASLRRHMQRGRQTQQVSSEPIQRDVVLPESITVQELASRMAVRGVEVVKALMKNGIIATINQMIDADTAELVVSEFGHKVRRVSEADVEEGIDGLTDEAGDLQPRSPIVTVMGHVDHGKTSLLDALRQTNVVSGEAGGITQHIGAYRVDIGRGLPVAFIDTPGHAAFTAMRARGAAVTDIVVLVVAADDGVMPQTVEAIQHAKAAKSPIVVAINKIDKPDANPERVRTELLSHDVVLEQFGGDVLAVEVSALKKQGLDKLIEAIQLQAEVLDLRANPAREAQGTIIEAQLDRGRGVAATVLVQNGTLKVGDIVIAGAQWGRARALIDDHGDNVTEAGPATPVEILGLDGVPEAGDRLQVVDTEKRARDIAEYRQRKRREQAQVITAGKNSLEEMFSQLKSGETSELPVVIKSDVHGSLEAIVTGLTKLSTDEVSARVLAGGVGAITESDVTLAMASRGVILGFNVRANAQAREMAKREGIEIRYYSIIYELLDEVKAILSGMLKPEAREAILGHAEIREVYSITKVGKIAGCRVTDGMVKRHARARLLRDDVVVFDGQLGSLKRFKDDVREVKEGFECGMSIENYNDIRTGDVIEVYEVEQIARTL
ncbi:translation initiation factor IF-2 [Arboricoccus pini]|uniref:Translation initiation factor IF-2 n=1 Tax=Arboricoccus pini TaxID=1963835 RepID=A0A212PYK9_9PROT|nr:translation initiation factor IF-2 [Arboricoccus pini]SNB52100.1 translation initiation factor IF-2 [Arboricoccus pini]